MAAGTVIAPVRKNSAPQIYGRNYCVTSNKSGKKGEKARAGTFYGLIAWYSLKRPASFSRFTDSRPAVRMAARTDSGGTQASIVSQKYTIIVRASALRVKSRVRAG